MRDILPDLDRWRGEGRTIALATVVATYGSAPRPLGSKMAVSSAGEVAGSVSGGCIEGAVFEEAQGVLASGEPRLLQFGITREMAWEVGLACGGEVEVFVERLPAVFPELRRCLGNEELAAVATVLAGPGVGRQLLLRADGTGQGSLGSDDLDRRVREGAAAALETLGSRRASFPVGEETAEVFVEVFPPSPQLILVGAVHVAIPLVTLARELGFYTVVVDPRPVFASRERFPHAHRLMVEWPQDALAQLTLNRSTYVAVLSHDDKLDDPALLAALASPARYVGALGSSRTHAKRLARLREVGVPEAQLARLHAPIGLDLGGRRPEEIALAILAEMVAVAHGGGVLGGRGGSG